MTILHFKEGIELTPECGYFFRVKLADKAKLIVGLASLSMNPRAEAIETVAQFSEQKQSLQIPNPLDMLQATVEVSIVSWSDYRHARTMSFSWPRIMGNSVSIEHVALCMADPGPSTQPDLSFGRPEQRVLL